MGRGALKNARPAQALSCEAGLPDQVREEQSDSMTKPLRCRLRLHHWETRENPETRERYEVCGRCDTYRDRGAAAPGAGAAGMTGTGFG
jgi:hypothetical protein